jgi:hypothetical protein
MPQTVYDVGDPITSRLALGITPDGTTQASVTITRPGGVVVAPTAVSGWAGDVMTAQFYATDDGTPTGSTVEADGDWLVVWRISGTGANVAPKIYNVVPLPGTGTRPDWSPFLSQVADHVPYLTVDTITPGSQIYLGTFTGATTPTDEVAQRHIDAAVDLTLLAGLTTTLYPAATAVAALRAAASLARAYPRRPEDLATAAALDARADAHWTRLQAAIDDLADGVADGDNFFDVVPMWTGFGTSHYPYC